MVLEDAMEFLQNTTRGLSVGDAWRGARHADMEPQFDHPNPQAFPSQRLNPQLPFAPPVSEIKLFYLNSFKVLISYECNSV